jgi:hypothetical protein
MYCFSTQKYPKCTILVLRVSVAPSPANPKFKIQKKVEVIRVSVAPKNSGDIEFSFNEAREKMGARAAVAWQTRKYRM